MTEPKKALVPVSSTTQSSRGRGRPSIFSAALADEICMRMAGDRESLVEICDDPAMPAYRTVMYWLEKGERGDPENPKDQPFIDFLHKYTRARERLYEGKLDEVLDIADDGRNDYILRKMKNGGFIPVVDHEHVNRSRLRAEMRLKIAEKVLPKKYGRLIEGESQGAHVTKNVTNYSFAAVVVKKAEEKTRGLPSETLLNRGKLDEDN